MVYGVQKCVPKDIDGPRIMDANACKVMNSSYSMSESVLAIAKCLIRVCFGNGLGHELISFFLFLPRTIRAFYIIYLMMKTKKDDGTFHKKFSIDELQLGFKFYADMLSRLCFFVICFIMILTFFCTFVQSWIRYNMQ